MQEIPFSIPVSGIIRIDSGKVTVAFKQAEVTMTVSNTVMPTTRFHKKNGKTIFDIVLATAQKLTSSGKHIFSAAELYEVALQDYPNLKRNSWGAHVIASAPNHSSYKHYSSQRDYLSYMAAGKYKLNEQYLPQELSA